MLDEQQITIIQTMSESHYLSLETFVTQAIEQKCLLVLVIDDYTSVHTKWRPLDEKPSEAKTMCTIVVKAFKDIPAISIDHASTVDHLNGIDIKSCKGIITSASCLHDIAKTYPTSMPTQAFFDPELQRQRINTHKYCESDNDRIMRKMDNLHLVEFAELRLKLMNEFEATYDIVLSTGLAKCTCRSLFSFSQEIGPANSTVTKLYTTVLASSTEVLHNRPTPFKKLCSLLMTTPFIHIQLEIMSAI